jgi:hypothetical protein
MTMPCPACADTGWVCEAHPDRPSVCTPNAPGACQCREPGMPCELCNPAGGIDEPPAKLPFERVITDRDSGSRH